MQFQRGRCNRCGCQIPDCESHCMGCLQEMYWKKNIKPTEYQKSHAYELFISYCHDDLPKELLKDIEKWWVARHI